MVEILQVCYYAFNVTKVIEIVSRKALTTCPLLHGNKKKETDTKKVFTQRDSRDCFCLAMKIDENVPI